MPRRTRVGYEAFAQWEVELAKRKIRTLIGKYDLAKEDLADMEQELLLHIHRRRDIKKSWKHITASDKTILDRVLDNKIRDLIDAHQSLKRKLLRHAEPLTKPLRSAEDDAIVTYETLLKEEQSFGHRGIPLDAREELKLALSLAAKDLNTRQKNILQAIEHTQSLSEAARLLGMHRTALARELKRMREIFYRRELNKYI